MQDVDVLMWVVEFRNSGKITYRVFDDLAEAISFTKHMRRTGSKVVRWCM